MKIWYIPFGGLEPWISEYDPDDREVIWCSVLGSYYMVEFDE